MRVNEKEYYEAWPSDPAANPVVFDVLTSMQSLDPNVFRLSAIDVRPEHIINGYATKINVVFVHNDPRSLEKVAEDEKLPQPYSKYKFISLNYRQTSSGIRTFVILEQWESVSSTNQTMLTYYKGVLFKVPSGTVAIDLFTPLDFKDTVLPEFDQVVDNTLQLNP